MIKMRFARCGDRLVDAYEEVCSGKRKRYDCAICSDRHKVHLVEGRHTRYHTPGWFSHAGSGNGGSGGISFGESETHMQAKFLLQKQAGRYYFTVQRCLECGLTADVSSLGCTVVVEERDPTEAYRYDAVLHDEHGFKAVMEVWHKHETDASKISYVRGKKLPYAEFDAENLITTLTPPRDLSSGTMLYLSNLKVQFYIFAI